jgi:DNA-directed RNA polymerase subunit RPC12/RpoP
MIVFKYLRFYLKNPITGELKVKYICKTCGKEMTKPKNYMIKHKNGIPDPFTATYQCDNCYNKHKKRSML